jgi:hypothetical protein
LPLTALTTSASVAPAATSTDVAPMVSVKASVLAVESVYVRWAPLAIRVTATDQPPGGTMPVVRSAVTRATSDEVRLCTSPQVPAEESASAAVLSAVSLSLSSRRPVCWLRKAVSRSASRVSPRRSSAIRRSMTPPVSTPDASPERPRPLTAPP